MKFLHVVLHAWICSSIFWFIVYGNLNRICILLLFENCINLNYAELVHDAFFKSTLPFHFLYIHYINFWEFNIKTSTIFLGSKIIADGDCSHEIKRRLPPGRKVRTNLDSILKSKDTSLSTRLHLVKGMVFPVVMYGCESWAVKKAECRKIDAFELWCWRRLLRVPWTARRSNQSILKEISPGCSLEGLMLKLKLLYFGHLMRRADSLERPWCWERSRAGGEVEDRGWGGWMASPTQWTWVWVNSRSW